MISYARRVKPTGFDWLIAITPLPVGVGPDRTLSPSLRIDPVQVRFTFLLVDVGLSALFDGNGPVSASSRYAG
jgi:hypothetical protein